MDPQDLTLAGRRLYDNVEHLEPGDGTYPWAAVCAMLAAPVDVLYTLVVGADDPWAPAFDPELAASLFSEEDARALGVWLGQFAGLSLGESLNLLQQRVTLTTSRAAQRMTPAAIKGAVRAQLAGPDDTPETATVYLNERIGDDPYEFAVATLIDETPDMDAVDRALRLNVGEPDGARKWTHVAIGGGTWADVFATHADWAEVATDFGTWQDVRDDPSLT